ncbi:MAG: NADH-quinone oxidoreductase subunit N [Candidatus Zixiibacteriota bacterium]|nr:MAG: NADH-quinone oxidoreductase subunit N [candidate division Zixibacteria bacterium]
MEAQLPPYSIKMMLPELFLFVWALVVITFDLLTRRKSGSAVGYLAMLGLVICGGILSITGYGRGFGMMFINDPVAVFFKVIFLGAAFMAIGSSFGITNRKIVNHRGEYFGLILLSTVGMMFLASSQELLSLYIGLELTTIPLFVLAGFFKDDRKSVESGIKYMIMGALSSALLLYGISFLYGLSGTTDIVQMKINLAVTQLANEGDIGVILILATVTILAGIGFKLALPPFHQWAPDVYEGSPTPIAAFLSVGSKAAGIVAFVKIMMLGLEAFYDPVMKPNDWGILVGVLAIAAMVWGNVAAVRQSNIKRMLAFSSIAQAGYIMIGMVAMNQYGLAAVGFYTFVYMFANMGAFAIVTVVEDQTGSCKISSYAGLSRTSPFLSAALAVFLLSLAGIPPLAGFFAKYYVFAAAIAMAGSSNGHTWLYWLVGVGLLTTVFALYYYANVIKTAYFAREASPYRLRPLRPALLVIAIGLLGVLIFGVVPETIVDFARDLPYYIAH